MKTLNEGALRDELAGSAFFHGQPSHNEPRPEAAAPASAGPTNGGRAHGTVAPRSHDTVTPAPHATEDVIEAIRKAVKQFGKEDATYRFTELEKKALADVVYVYTVAGVRTSQNEIARIGINYLLEDYRRTGKGSVLARVLKRLNE
jgi:hypothetical protein